MTGWSVAGWPDVALLAWIVCGFAAVTLTLADLKDTKFEPFDWFMLVYTFLWGPVSLIAAIYSWKRYR